MKARRGGPRSLATMLPDVAKRTLRRRGLAEVSIIADWPSIVGPVLAAASSPRQLTYPRGKRAGGTLHITVAGSIATELQHLEPLVLERINGYFGYRAVERLRFVHGPLPDSTNVQAKPRQHDTTGATGPMVPQLERVQDDDLRRALERLGRAVFAASRSAGRE